MVGFERFEERLFVIDGEGGLEPGGHTGHDNREGGGVVHGGKVDDDQGGGEVDAGFAIYDTMRALQCDVATVCMGFAASMAQFLLCGGAKGMRAAYAHSRILMHQPHGAVEGVAVDVAIQAEQFTRARHLVAELTAQHTGQTLERVLTDGERDRWFTPEDARDYGMIDDIIS